MTGYRESPEWEAVMTALNNLAESSRLRNNTGEICPGCGENHDNGPQILESVAIVVHTIPVEPTDYDAGGYYHYASNPMPHANRGLHAEGDEYWKNYSWG